MLMLRTLSPSSLSLLHTYSHRKILQLNFLSVCNALLLFLRLFFFSEEIPYQLRNFASYFVHHCMHIKLQRTERTKVYSIESFERGRKCRLFFGFALMEQCKQSTISLKHEIPYEIRVHCYANVLNVRINDANGT